MIKVNSDGSHYTEYHGFKVSQFPEDKPYYLSVNLDSSHSPFIFDLYKGKKIIGTIDFSKFCSENIEADRRIHSNKNIMAFIMEECRKVVPVEEDIYIDEFWCMTFIGGFNF